MRHSLLAVGGVALLIAGSAANANSVSTGTWSATVGPDATAGLDDIALAGDGVTFLGLPGVVAASDFSPSFELEYDVEFTPAAGYRVDTLHVDMTLQGSIGPAYTGTIYGYDPGPGAAFASISSPFASLYIDGTYGYGATTESDFDGDLGPSLTPGYVSFAYNAELFCIVPLNQCEGLWGQIGVVTASASVTSFLITPVLTAIPEPDSLTLLLAGLVPAMQTRWRLGRRHSRTISAKV